MRRSAASPGSNAPAVSSGVTGGAVFLMLLWALCFPLIHVGLRYAPPMEFAAMRAALSGVVLLALAHILRRPPLGGGRHWGGLIAIGLTATSIGFFGMFYGGRHIAPGLATVIANTQPLMAAALARAFLGERLRRIQYWGLAAGFAGIVVIAAPTLTASGAETGGLLLILFAAAGVAVSNLFLKEHAGRVDGLRAMGWQLLIGSVPLALLAVSTENIHAIDWSGVFVLTWVVLSVVGTSAAYLLWFALLERASLSELNVFTFLTPVFGLLAGALFFAEAVHGSEWAGITLSVLGIYWVSRTRRGDPPPADP